jgi:hypothetical protein
VQFTRQKADSCLIVSWDWGALTAAILGEAIAMVNSKAKKKFFIAKEKVRL